MPYNPDIPANWDAYVRRWEAMKDRMEKFIQTIAEPFEKVEVWEDNVEDYGWHVSIEREDGNKLDLDLSIWDSGDADDGVYGVHGNFHCGLVEEGGLIVGGCIPHNYSDRVWVDYSDDDEWETRLQGFEENVLGFIHAIEEWMNA